jgi:hypothetical protein
VWYMVFCFTDGGSDINVRCEYKSSTSFFFYCFLFTTILITHGDCSGTSSLPPSRNVSPYYLHSEVKTMSKWMRVMHVEVWDNKHRKHV